jgi:hypothetical protein
MALCVFTYFYLFAGGVHATVDSQRFTQGEIENFDVFVRVVVGDAILEVLNNEVIFAGNRRIEQTSLEILHLLVQNLPCSDKKVVQSLETFFRSNTVRTSKSTLFGWTTCQCQHIFRFSVQWGEARDTIHFVGTLSQPHPHYVPGDQMLCPVTTSECGQNSGLVGRHFEVQVGFTLQMSDDDDAKFEQVFSLLPVGLYTLLLSCYSAFNRHTIKLTLVLQCSKGVNHSPAPFELVVQVRTSSPSATAAAPDSCISTRGHSGGSATPQPSISDVIPMGSKRFALQTGHR